MCLKQLNNNEKECVDFEARFCCPSSETNPQLSRRELNKSLTTTDFTTTMTTTSSTTISTTTTSTTTSSTITTFIMPNNVSEPAKPLSYEGLDYTYLRSEDLRQFIQIEVVIDI